MAGQILFDEIHHRAQVMFRAGQVVRLHAHPKTTVMLRADRDIAEGDATARISISGYLVDA